MTQRIYKTARGKTIDLGALVLRNEKTRAVGNMPVNARGDRIDSFNNVIETKSEQVTRSNRKGVVTAQPVSAPTQNPPEPKREPVPEVNRLTPDTDITSGELLNVAPPPTVESDPVVNSGLAAALKKAKKDNSSNQ